MFMNLVLEKHSKGKKKISLGLKNELLISSVSFNVVNSLHLLSDITHHE